MEKTTLYDINWVVGKLPDKNVRDKTENEEKIISATFKMFYRWKLLREWKAKHVTTQCQGRWKLLSLEKHKKCFLKIIFWRNLVSFPIEPNRHFLDFNVKNLAASHRNTMNRRGDKFSLYFLLHLSLLTLIAQFPNTMTLSLIK